VKNIQPSDEIKEDYLLTPAFKELVAVAIRLKNANIKVLAYLLLMSGYVCLLSVLTAVPTLCQTVNRLPPQFVQKGGLSPTPQKALSILDIREALKQAKKQFPPVRVTCIKVTRTMDAGHPSVNPSDLGPLQNAPLHIPLQPPVVTDQIEVAYKGNKVYCHFSPLQDPTQEEDTEIYDGKQQNSISRLSTTSKLTDTLKNRSQAATWASPLDCSYTFEVGWNADTVSEFPFHISRVIYDNRFGRLYILDGDDKTYALHYQFWIAPEYGYIAVRSSMRARGRDVATETRAVCEQAMLLNGVWLPIKCKIVHLSAKSGSTPEVTSVEEFKDIRYSFDVPDSLFTPKLPVGSDVYDVDKHLIYHVTDKGWILDPRSVKANEQHYLFAWLFIGSLTALVLILSGIFIGWRRRQRGA
jgi:hypothetical protein